MKFFVEDLNKSEHVWTSLSLSCLPPYSSICKYHQKKIIKKKVWRRIETCCKRSHNTKKSNNERVDSQNLFCKTNLQKQKIMVPMYLAPLSPKNKKNTRNYCSPCRQKNILENENCVKKNLRKKYVTKMKKRISHTQSTTNYCLISSTFQKSFKKNLPL